MENSIIIEGKVLLNGHFESETKHLLLNISTTMFLAANINLLAHGDCPSALLVSLVNSSTTRIILN